MNTALKEVIELLQTTEFLVGPLGKGMEANLLVSEKFLDIAQHGGFDDETQQCLLGLSQAFRNWQGRPEDMQKYTHFTARLRTKFANLAGEA